MFLTGAGGRGDAPITAKIERIAQGANTYRPPVYTGGGLRHPAFKGMRIDRTAIDVDLPGLHCYGATTHSRRLSDDRRQLDLVASIAVGMADSALRDDSMRARRNTVLLTPW
ncbi:hypothetical protein GEO20_16925 [Rhodococcus erythropolis]|nr:hypothetical protein [Rhodococcus erythropolis]